MLGRRFPAGSARKLMGRPSVSRTGPPTCWSGSLPAPFAAGRWDRAPWLGSGQSPAWWSTTAAAMRSTVVRRSVSTEWFSGKTCRRRVLSAIRDALDPPFSMRCREGSRAASERHGPLEPGPRSSGSLPGPAATGDLSTPSQAARFPATKSRPAQCREERKKSLATELEARDGWRQLTSVQDGRRLSSGTATASAT